MAVRELNGSSDDIVRAIGALSDMAYGTIVALTKVDDLSTDRTINGLHFSNGDIALAFYAGSIGNHALSNGDFSDIFIAPLEDVWCIAVIRKPDGEEDARLSLYRLDTQSWDHDSGGAMTNVTPPGAGGVVRFADEDGDFFSGRVAAVAVWSNSLPWSADASGDTAIVAAGLETSAAAWLAESPDEMWLFRQGSTDQAVLSVTGGGAHQTQVFGTTVITGDDPPGFDFALDVYSAEVLADSPIRYWRLEEGSGMSSVTDEVADDTGTVNGSVDLDASGRTNLGSAADFNGGTIDVADQAVLDLPDAFTLSAWVRPDAAATAGIVDKRTLNTSDGWELGLDSSGTAFVRVNQNTSGDTFRVDATTSYPTTGGWQFLVATFDGTDLRIYVDGTLEDTVTGPASVGSNSDGMVIGASLDGAVDEVAIYDYALSATRIQAQYDTATAGDTPPEVTASIGLSLDVSPVAEVEHQVAAGIELGLDIAATTETTPLATTSVPLSLAISPVAQALAPSEVTASIALALGISPMASDPTLPEVTTSIPLSLDVAPVGQTTYNATASIALNLLLGPESTVTHDVTTDIPLLLVVSPLVDAPPLPTFRFFPPTRLEGPGVPPGEPYYARRLFPTRLQGVSLVQDPGSGLFVEKRYLTEDDYSGKVNGVDYFVGGYRYKGVPQEVADLLVDSGYEPELEDA